MPESIASAADEDKYLRETVANDAATRSRKAALPQKPDDYKFGLSPEFKAPQGLEFKLDEKDPLVGQYRAFAHESGLDQAQFTKGLDLIAALKVGEAQQFNTARTAELGKLGATANDRITSVVQWLTAMAGDKAAGMVGVLQMAPRADTIEALETVIQKFSSQGVANFSARGREHVDAGQEIPGYDKMDFTQRRHAQDQMRSRGAAR